MNCVIWMRLVSGERTDLNRSAQRTVWRNAAGSTRWASGTTTSPAVPWRSTYTKKASTSHNSPNRTTTTRLPNERCGYGLNVPQNCRHYKECLLKQEKEQLQEFHAAIVAAVNNVLDKMSRSMTSLNGVSQATQEMTATISQIAENISRSLESVCDVYELMSQTAASSRAITDRPDGESASLSPCSMA